MLCLKDENEKSEFTHDEIFSILSDRESSSIWGRTWKWGANKENWKIL